MKINRIYHLPLGVFVLLLFFSAVSFYRGSDSTVDADNDAPRNILAAVRSSIEYDEKITNKKEVTELLAALEKSSSFTQTGSDDLRIKFVTSQGSIEHVLACFLALGEIEELVGVIHTPTPATPLCVKAEGSVNDILDESIRQDAAKLLTVRSRAQIVREYLIKGGRLRIVYPQGGLEKRTKEQQQIYLGELGHFAGSLIDCPLPLTKLSEEMIGATYLFRNPNKQLFAFSIKARQANDIQSESEWGIWFGSASDKAVSDRINEVFDYLAENGGPDLRKELSL